MWLSFGFPIYVKSFTSLLLVPPLLPEQMFSSVETSMKQGYSICSLLDVQFEVTVTPCVWLLCRKKNMAVSLGGV